MATIRYSTATLVLAFAAALLWVGCGKAKAPAAAADQAPAQGAVQAGGTQTLCPVMNGPIDKKLFVDYEGKRIYVCCASCLGTVRKDPAKYVKQLEDTGIVLDKAEPTPTDTGAAKP